ncbi:MAG: hypothetical protein K9J37_12380 [Saprospiraceae bacterium]|nr:hypothetical protein [Saprospiraceae bacterium]MCF8250707.1 hypothetical protein [Saprospiraceae bacterium]MCF8279763.1 hypothetical protein [Bacteroidales bacterium]MCF8310531.1 hypothetical protein [Saprospiraceae bacterium]MCF8440837.1 hypothetical protein [Saprospiraceae bacterium]
MSSERTKFIDALFSWLQGQDYLWLKAIIDCPADTRKDSDIDLFIKKENLLAVVLFISKQPSIADIKMTSQRGVIYLNLVFTDGITLKLDLLTQLVRKQWEYLTADYLFANRIWKNGFATYKTEVLLEHVLLFNYLNHSGLPSKYVAYFGEMTRQEQVRLIGFFNQKYGTDFASFLDMANFRQAARANIIQHLKATPENNFEKKLLNGLGYIKQKLNNRFKKLGKVITFTGVDGAGKSTLLGDLKAELTEKYGQKVVVLRHRPSVLPILSAWKHGKQAAEAQSVSRLPRQGNNHSKFSSLFRFGYYYADYLLGQVYIWLRYLLPGYTVIYDRYYFDFIVDAKRTNISLGSGLPKWLYRFVAKPNLNIFLYADPDIIRQRKQELPVSVITTMTGQYRRLFEEFGQSYRGNYLCIDNTDRTASFHLILDSYLKTCMPC